MKGKVKNPNESELEKVRMQVIKLLAVIMFFCVGAAGIVVLSLFIPPIAFYGVLMVVAIGIVVWALDALTERQTDRIARIHQATIEGFVYAQAADDRGEILRNAVRLAATNGQMEGRALSLNSRIQEEAKKLASQAQPPKRSEDDDFWNAGNDFQFAETE